jgi:hypothetical protein
LKDDKGINVKGINLLFECDAAAVDIDGNWMLPRRLGSQAQGRVFRQEAGGSISVLFQGPHEGCHVQLQGLTTRADLNGCFGYFCGAFNAMTQRWPVRVTLASDEVNDASLKAGNLVCTGKVMARDGNVRPRAVPAFASDWLTAQRPGADVMRFRGEDVKRARPEDVLAGVTDALGDVAAAVGSSGLVEVDEAGRLFGMHLLQKAVRAELWQAHDDGMAALLEGRCGCMDDEDRVDYQMYGVMREVGGAAGHVFGRMKAAAAQRAAWVCSMHTHTHTHTHTHFELIVSITRVTVSLLTTLVIL